MAAFVYKPVSSGQLNPGGTSVIVGTYGVSDVGLYTSSGQLLENLKPASPHEKNIKFYSGKSGASYGNDVVVKYKINGQEYSQKVGSGGQYFRSEIEGESNEGPYPEGGAGQFTPGQQGYGFFPPYLGNDFPDPVTVKTPKFNFTDPIEYAKNFGNYASEQVKKNFKQSQDMALEALDTELKGLEQFVPAASALKRQETSLDNEFNQAERTKQVNQALPGVAGQLDAQAARAEAFAEGRVPDSIQDRALELGIRSRAADAASAGGFGASSMTSGRISDLMSAEQRIRLSQYGDQLLSGNINQKAGLFLAPTEYSNAGSQINVTPSLSGSQLTSNFLGELNNRTMISPEAGLDATIRQEQFKTNLKQATDQFNANIQNNFAMSKFAYKVGYGAAVTGAYQTDMNTQTALDMQEKYQQIFDESQKKTQESNEAGSISEGISTIVSGISSAITAIAGTSKDKDKTNNANTQADSPNSGESHFLPNTQFYDGTSVGGPQGSIVVPSGSAPPAGYNDNVGMSVQTPDGGGGSLYVPNAYVAAANADFSNAAGANFDLASNPGTAQAFAQSNSVMQTAGISQAPAPGMQAVGVSPNGNPVYASTAMLQNSDGGAGSGMVSTLQKVLDPTGVLSSDDSTAMQKISAISGDTAFIAQLSALQEAGDSKGFMNTLLSRFSQPTIEAVTKDPQNQAGLAGAFTAYQMYSNWGQMSPAQKSMGMAALGLQGYKYSTGESFAEKHIIKPQLDASGKEVTPGLTVGQGLGLFQAGYNTYSLVKNWDQMSNLQKIAAGSGDVAQIAQLARSFDLIGAGTQGAAVPGITMNALQGAGWATTPHLGVGAISSATGANLPSGYSAIATAADGSVVAVPTANAGTATGAVSAQAGSLLTTAAGVAGIAAGAYSVYKGWGQGGKKGAINGTLGGSAMAAGLYTLGATNPYLMAGVIAVSVLGNAFGDSKSKDHLMRDSTREMLKKNGIVDKNFFVTLADGSRVDIGKDGKSGRHEIYDRSKLTKEQKDLNHLNSWDTDYTNDLDYMAGTAATSITTLIAGGKNQGTSQLGGQLGNAALSSVGYGKDFSQGNFNTVRNNLRAMASQSGIKSKADGYQLANQAYAEGRIDESTMLSIHQSLNMMYDDNGYQTAQSLMAGRWRGVEVASENSKVVQPKTDQAGEASKKLMEAGAKLPANAPLTPENGNIEFLSEGGDAQVPMTAQASYKLADISSVVNGRKRARRSNLSLTKEQLQNINRRRYQSQEMVA